MPLTPAALLSRPTSGSPALWRGFLLEGGDADPEQLLRLAPAGVVWGDDAVGLIEDGQALPLAGDRRAAVTHWRLFLRRPEAPAEPSREIASREIVSALVSLDALRAWTAAEGTLARSVVEATLARHAAARPPFAGVTLPPGRTQVMGIVNVTPDSFSDGGDHASAEAAIAHGLALQEAGAVILDVGGESTRPGAAAVDPDTEIARVVPVVRGLAERGAVVSIDTRHPRTMAAALDAGARIVNDITALADPDALTLVATRRVPVILMHMQGEPRTMQANPTYDHAALDVHDALAARVARVRAAGVAEADLCIDPGLGFGKTLAHNLEILRHGCLLLGLGTGVLIAASRKRFIGAITGAEAPKARGPGSLAVAIAAQGLGASLVRVHDVGETVQALAMDAALR